MVNDVKDWIEKVLCGRSWTTANCQGNVYSLVADGTRFNFAVQDGSLWMNMEDSAYQRPWQGCGFSVFQVAAGSSKQYVMAGRVNSGQRSFQILVSPTDLSDPKAPIRFQLGGENLSQLVAMDDTGGWTGE